MDLKLRKIADIRRAIQQEEGLIERAQERIRALKRKQLEEEQTAKAMQQYEIPLNTPHA